MNQHWGIPSSNSSTSTTNSTDLISTSTATAIKEDSHNISGEGSNVAGGQLGDTQDLNMAAVKTEPSPASGGTVSAAADSSDNQPPTPTPNENSAYNNQMYPPSGDHPAYHHPAAYSYDQSYHYGSPSAGDYSNVMQQSQQQMYGSGDFKPSARFHPYMANNTTSNTSSSISTSGSISPRVVSSSSPAIMGQNGQQTSVASQQEIKCEKCGYVCTSDIQLNEHYATAHTADGVIKEEGNSNSQFSFAPYAIKQEDPPQSDILDLDSQKMVYPPDPNDPNIPPMHAMHPMHRPMMGQQWGHNGQPQDMHYMQQPPTTPSDPHKTFFSPLKQPQQSPYPPTGMIKPDANHYSPIGTPPYSMPPQSAQQKPPYSQNDSVSSSPSEFPSTTTQDGGPPGFGQQRFEPPTSSLPNPPLGKSAATWKSNEARRPKTYNCTACNKWFTSSGHLKRHYNTTLHKNAVKSSNQPDPATMPISVHHHPDRDPNSKHSRPRHHRPPAPPPDPTRSPEYGTQFAGQSPNYQSQQQNFSNFPQQNLNGHPNGLAGPSVHPNNPSHPRGLLNNLNSEVQSPTTTPSSLPVDQQMEQEVHTTTIKREDSFTQLQTELEVDSSNNSSHSSNHSLEHHPQLHQPHQHLLSSQQQTATQQHQQQQHQQSPPVHIISHHIFHTNTPQHLSPREDTIHTTQHNIMDQQQYIISPLGINPTTPTPITQHTGEVQQSGDITTTTSTLQQHNITTTVAPTPIPSFQHLQLPVEHQVNYPTHIIGNGNDLDSFDNDSNHSNSNTPIHLHDSHDTQNHNTIFSHNSDQNLLQLGTAASSLGSPTTTTYEIHQMSSPSEHSSSASMSPVPVYQHQQHHNQQQQQIHHQLHSQNQTLFQPITLIENHDDQQQQMTHTIISNSHQLHQHHITNTDGHILQIIPSTTPPMQLHQMDQTDHLTNYHNNIQQTNYIHINNLQQQEFLDLQRMSGGVPTYREKLTQPYSPVVPESDNSLLLRISPFTNQRSPQEADMPPSTYTITNAQQQQSHTQYPYSPTISSTQTVIANQTPSITSTGPKKRAQKRKRDSNTHVEGGKIVCIECDKEFSKICYLTQHNKTFHNGEQPFRCQKCGKRFPNEELYDTHLERHVSQDKPFKCDLCPKQFHHKTDLRRHKEAIHTGLKAHVCDLCNKSFCRKDHLRKHIETHSRAKPVRRMKNTNSLQSTNNNNNFIVLNNNRSGAVGMAGMNTNIQQPTISSMFLKNDLGMKEEFEEVEEYICDDEEVIGV